MKKFIHYPLVEDPGFEGITKSNRWQSDEVFTLQRLAGLNPMSLKKLSEDGMEISYTNDCEQITVHVTVCRITY